MEFYEPGQAELQRESRMEAETDSGCEEDGQLQSGSDGLVKISEELQQRQQDQHCLPADTETGK